MSTFIARLDRQRSGRPATSDVVLESQARQYSDLHGPVAAVLDGDSRREVERALLADEDFAG